MPKTYIIRPDKGTGAGAGLDAGMGPVVVEQVNDHPLEKEAGLEGQRQSGSGNGRDGESNSDSTPPPTIHEYEEPMGHRKWFSSEVFAPSPDLCAKVPLSSKYSTAQHLASQRILTRIKRPKSLTTYGCMTRSIHTASAPCTSQQRRPGPKPQVCPASVAAALAGGCGSSRRHRGTSARASRCTLTQSMPWCVAAVESLVRTQSYEYVCVRGWAL